MRAECRLRWLGFSFHGPGWAELEGQLKWDLMDWTWTSWGLDTSPIVFSGFFSPPGLATQAYKKNAKHPQRDTDHAPHLQQLLLPVFGEIMAVFGNMIIALNGTFKTSNWYVVIFHVPLRGRCLIRRWWQRQPSPALCLVSPDTHSQCTWSQRRLTVSRGGSRILILGGGGGGGVQKIICAHTHHEHEVPYTAGVQL